MLPLSPEQEAREAQRIYDRGVYAGILLLFWSLFFLTVRHPFMDFFVSSCISACMMAIYTPLLRKVRKMLERNIHSPSRRQLLVLAATVLYDAVPLWALRNALPLWMIIVLGTIMTLYYCYALFVQQPMGSGRETGI